VNIKVTYELEWTEAPPKSKRFRICKIEIYDNSTLKEWKNTRY